MICTGAVPLKVTRLLVTVNGFGPLTLNGVLPPAPLIVLMAGRGVTGEEVLHVQAAAIARAAGANEGRMARNSALQAQLNAIIKQKSDPQVRESRIRELREKLKLPAGQQFTAAATPRRAAIATT